LHSIGAKRSAVEPKPPFLVDDKLKKTTTIKKISNEWLHPRKRYMKKIMINDTNKIKMYLHCFLF